MPDSSGIFFKINFNSKAIINKKIFHLITLFAVLGFTIFCGTKIKSLKFDYDFEAFFPNEDKELELYNTYRKTFEYDNEFVLVALENKKGIFNKEFLLKINNLTSDFSKIEYVKRVVSPTNLKALSLGGLVPFQTHILHYDSEELYASDSTNIYTSGEYVGSFFPLNAKSVTIFIKTEDGLSKVKSDSLARKIEESIDKYEFDDIHYVGRIFAQEVYLKNLESEFVYFLGISFVLVILFLWLSFRSIYGVLVPISIVLISIFWTLGIMALFNKSIDIMTVMLPTMIFIAGMSDVVHFFSKYFEEVAKDTDKHKIYPLILKEVGFPTFLTLLTTVVGFLSLLFSSIKPIKDFGIYTSIGIVIAFILTYTLLPSLLYFFTPKKLINIHSQNNNTMKVMRKGIVWIFRNQKLIVVISLLLLIISIGGIFKIRVNNLLLDDLSDKVKIKQDFNYFDREYSGVRPLELQIKLKNKNNVVWDYEIIKQINSIEEFVKNEYNAGFIYSPASIIKSLNYSLTGEINKLPTKDDFENISNELRKNKKNREINRIVTQDLKSAKLSAKISDMGSIEVNKHNSNLNLFIQQNTDTSKIEISITGAAHLVDLNNSYMVNNMITGFGFSLLVIAFLTFLLHRSWRMVLVFIIPNLFPLLVMAGVMGYSNIELKSATSLVFSIALGVATDDTIHFISRLKIELGYGKSLLYAFKRTYFETGRPILLTTFILMGGFMSLMISDFQSTFYFGFLICVTVILALLADIFLLPVLLFALFKKK